MDYRYPVHRFREGRVRYIYHPLILNYIFFTSLNNGTFIPLLSIRGMPVNRKKISKRVSKDKTQSELLGLLKLLANESLRGAIPRTRPIQPDMTFDTSTGDIATGFLKTQGDILRNTPILFEYLAGRGVGGGGSLELGSFIPGKGEDPDTMFIQSDETFKEIGKKKNKTMSHEIVHKLLFDIDRIRDVEKFSGKNNSTRNANEALVRRIISDLPDDKNSLFNSDTLTYQDVINGIDPRSNIDFFDMVKFMFSLSRP